MTINMILSESARPGSPHSSLPPDGDERIELLPVARLYSSLARSVTCSTRFTLERPRSTCGKAGPLPDTGTAMDWRDWLVSLAMSISFNRIAISYRIRLKTGCGLRGQASRVCNLSYSVYDPVNGKGSAPLPRSPKQAVLNF